MVVNPTSTPAVVVTLAVQQGENLTHLATRAVNIYVSQRTITLDPVQRLYVVTKLTRAHQGQALATGASVSFTVLELDSLVAQAQQLTPSARAAWSVYLK